MTIDLLMTLGYTAVVLVAGGAIGTYAREKGRNLATKEDVGEITDQVEAVRREHQAEIERLRTELTKTVHAHRVQVELELDAYRDVWRALVRARRATLGLRPVLDTVPEEGEEARRKKRLAQFEEAFSAYLNAVDEWRPFYPPEIFEHLNDLVKTYHEEAIDYSLTDPEKREYWEKAQQNVEEITRLIDEICEAIRERVQSLTVPHGEL